MKVGILTLPLWQNYGGILQAYALRKSVESLGHDAILIDVKREDKSFYASTLIDFKRWVKANLLVGLKRPYYPNTKEINYITSHTRLFIREKINPITNHISISKAKEFCKNLDIVIVGSDQVWRAEYCPDLDLYTLNFENNLKSKISYAASFGTNDWRFNDSDTIKCKNSLTKFDYLSVREESAVKLIRDKLNLKSIQVCDPTLLLEKEDYLKVADIPETDIPVDRGIFAYILDPNECRMKGLKDVSRNLDKSIFYLMPKPFDKNFRSNPEDYVFPPVESWIRSFHESSFLLTDSFHGCVFAIIFNKPFIAIANIDRGVTRFQSLLNKFNLQDRLFDSVASIDPNIFHQEIDWQEVNRIKEQEKKRGTDFLKLVLTGES